MLMRKIMLNLDFGENHNSTLKSNYYIGIYPKCPVEGSSWSPFRWSVGVSRQERGINTCLWWVPVF